MSADCSVGRIGPVESPAAAHPSILGRVDATVPVWGNSLKPHISHRISPAAARIPGQGGGYWSERCQHGGSDDPRIWTSTLVEYMSPCFRQASRISQAWTTPAIERAFVASGIEAAYSDPSSGYWLGKTQPATPHFRGPIVTRTDGRKRDSRWEESTRRLVALRGTEDSMLACVRRQ